MNEDMARYGDTALQIRGQVNLVQEIMKSVMQEGQHYGNIPGCGDKPTLLKPGAEKLSLAFHLRPIIGLSDIVMVDMGNGHREVTVHCHIINTAGEELATGIGSCSTLESKYRYRGGLKIPTGQAVPKEYWNLKKEGKGSEAQSLIGGIGFGTLKGDSGWEICELGEKTENPDIADQYNTVLKMAKKRAYVDGILSATGASDIFTQDIEDMSVEKTPTSGKPYTTPPQTKSQPAAGEVLEIVGFVEGITFKEGNTKGKPWTLYTIKVAECIFTTFDKKHAEYAKDAKEMGQPVRIDYTVGEKGNILGSIKAEIEEEGDGQ